MKDIDKIIEMLSWYNSEEIQEEGIKLGEKIKCLDPFIQPTYGGKSVWENCAKILYTKTDEELKYYLSKLMEWLQDLNWPGATIIQERLKKYDKNNFFNLIYDINLKKAQQLNNTSWLMCLTTLKENN